MKKRLIIGLVIVVGLAVLTVFTFYPGNQDVAEAEFTEYLKKQGVDSSKISSKEILKDYKIGGYVFKITYRDDPTYRYEYFYDADLEQINLIVYEGGRGIEEGMKYPPVNDYK